MKTAFGFAEAVVSGFVPQMPASHDKAIRLVVLHPPLLQQPVWQVSSDGEDKQPAPHPGPSRWPLAAVARTVYALFRPAAGPSPLIVYFHGLGGQLAGNTTELVEHLGRTGFAVLAIEYPGAGLAARYAPLSSETAICDDAEKMLRHVLRETGPRPVVLLGYSLGTGVATELASRGLGDRLILVAPYTSVVDVLKTTIPTGALAEITKGLANKALAFETARKAPGVRIPTLVLHGSEDQVVPFDMGVRLSKLFPNAELVVFRGADHFLLRPPTLNAILHIIRRFALGVKSRLDDGNE